MTDYKYVPTDHIIDAFHEHLERMTRDDWDKVLAAWDAWDATWEAWHAAWLAPREATWNVARNALWEIQRANLMRERGEPFVFLPMFGFSDEHAVIAALQPKEETK